VGAQRGGRPAEPLEDRRVVARDVVVLELDRQDAVVAVRGEPSHDGTPVDDAVAGRAVRPPALGVAVDGGAGPAGAVAVGVADLHVLGLREGDAVGVRGDDGDRVDAEPDEVGGVVVEVEPEVEHPLPQLGREREVPRVPVRGATRPSRSSR
jgi:hypothetical protein